jgi:stage IV sporulation protein FB
MLKSWRLGQVFGFPVEINLSFLLLLALVYVAFGGVAGVVVVGLAFGSVLLHELGHAVVARRLGVHVAGIELSFLGGAARMAQMPRNPDHEIAIAAAGPAVSLVLGGLGLALGSLIHIPLFGYSLFATIGTINLGLAAFNLIPALPMDGGRILRALLARKLSYVRATDIAVTVARVVAVGFVLLALRGPFQLLVLAPYLWMMGSREKLLARAADPGGGFGGSFGGFPRGHGPSGHPPGWGFHAAPYDRPAGFGRRSPDGLPIRRFTVRQVDGRMVIEALD